MTTINISHLWRGPVKAPPPRDHWTKDDLIKHIKTGMSIELGTLPIYFCALYSINRDNGGWGTKARANILAVAEQEMLHLSLAGNMLTALDAKQSLYDSAFMPTYPSQILFDKIDMKLQPANKENLECFLKIEAPFLQPPIPPPVYGVSELHIIPEYDSIGQFYKELEHGIEQLSAQDPDLFKHNTDRQFTGEDFFNSKMTVVTDRRTALQALETIVDQGEGSVGVPDSHYAIFVQLYQMRKEWTCIPFIDEPRTEKYKANTVAYHLSLAVNASYCYLLQTIDRFWQESMSSVTRRQALRNIHRIMVAILSPSAHTLVGQEINSGQFAAPCFEYYPPTPTGETKAPPPLAPQALFDALKQELKAAQDAASGDTKAEIAKIIFSLDGLGPAL